VLLYEGKREEDIPATWLEIPASALVERFRGLDVPADQIIVLQRAAASAANVEQQLKGFLRRSRPGDMLVFYFSGHSGRNTLGLHDQSVQKTWLIQLIETHFRGNRAMLFIDSCYSGGVVEVVDDRRSRISYAVLSSTFSQQTARSGCRFYQCMLRGLSGNPVVDLDQDGFVTFDELSRYTERYMAFAAEGKPMSVTTGRFDPKFRLAKATGKAGPRVGELVERNRKGSWHKAEILENTPNGIKIHYTRNTKPDDDDVVPADMLREPWFDQFKAGQRVEVFSGVTDQWHNATVIRMQEGLHFCRLDNLPPSRNEWFGPSRIRQLAGPEGVRELQRWQGVYRIPDGTTLTVSCDRWTWTRNDATKSSFTGQIKILDVRDQMTLADLIVEEGTTKGEIAKAIFRLEGNTLHYCGTYNTDRPTEFKGTAESNPVYLKWQHVTR
jgi:uncharacterized protein (TIGR03067 family)